MSDPLVNAVPPRQRALVAASAVSGVGAGLAEAWCVAATGSLLAHLVDGTDPGRGGWLVAAAATAWAVATAAALWCGRSGGYGLSQALHDSLAAQVMRLPLGWFGRSREAELSKLFGGEVMAVMSIPAHLLLPGLRAVTVAVALIGVLAVQSPAAAVVAALWMPVLAAVQVIAGNKVAAGEAALAAARRDAAARLMEFTDGQRSLRMLPDPLHGRTVVAATIDDVSRRMAQVIEPVLGVMGVFSLAVQFMLITVIAAGVIGGNLPGGGIGVVLAATALAAALQAAAGLGATTRDAVASLAGVRDFLAADGMPEPAVPGPVPVDGRLQAEHVTVTGGDGNKILDDVSVTIPEKSLVAVVGPSGSGKTTFLRALARFIDPDRGTIRVGGHDAAAIGSAAVQSAVSMVFQEPTLLHGTIRDNIWLNTAHPAKDTGVVDRARLRPVLDRLPAGADTELTDQGQGLSGGEKQRVALARAFAKKAPVVLCDEPTASLDRVNREHIDEALARLRGDATVVVVTHRLSFAARCDLVLVFDAGRLVQQGTHDELAAADGVYAALLAADTGGGR